MWKTKTLCWTTLVVKAFNTKGNVFTTAKTRLALLASFLFLCVLSAGCQEQQARDQLQLQGSTMGTSYHITVVAPEGKQLGIAAEELQAVIDEQLRQINQSMSTYIPDSELMRFNRAPVGEWQALSVPLIEVLQISQKISAKSDGAFDITIGPLVDLWGFGPQGEPKQVPEESEITRVREHMGFEHLALDETGRARKLADIRLDLSAVAKGYGVDVLSRYLESRGFEHFLVEIGGELQVKGYSPRGDYWRLAIEQPSLLHSGGRKTIELTDVAMATSGDYRNYYERDGQRYSHTIDPVTGRPIAHNLVSVTVLADSTAEADAWATALNVLGPERAMELAEREDLAIYMIVKEENGFADRHSKAFEPYL